LFSLCCGAGDETQMYHARLVWYNWTIYQALNCYFYYQYSAWHCGICLLSLVSKLETTHTCEALHAPRLDTFCSLSFTNLPASLFAFSFFFWWDWGLNSVLHKYPSAWATPPAHFALLILEMRCCKLFSRSGLEPWSSQVARITGVSHWCQDVYFFAWLAPVSPLYLCFIAPSSELPPPWPLR
jgi:hypothetical protein